MSRKPLKFEKTSLPVARSDQRREIPPSRLIARRINPLPRPESLDDPPRRPDRVNGGQRIPRRNDHAPPRTDRLVGRRAVRQRRPRQTRNTGRSVSGNPRTLDVEDQSRPALDQIRTDRPISRRLRRLPEEQARSGPSQLIPHLGTPDPISQIRQRQPDGPIRAVEQLRLHDGERRRENTRRRTHIRNSSQTAGESS